MTSPGSRVDRDIKPRRNIAAVLRNTPPLAAHAAVVTFTVLSRPAVVNNGSIRCKTRGRETIVYQRLTRVSRAVIHFGSPASGRSGCGRPVSFSFFVREERFRLDARIRFDSVICLSFPSFFVWLKAYWVVLCRLFGVIGSTNRPSDCKQ